MISASGELGDRAAEQGSEQLLVFLPPVYKKLADVNVPDPFPLPQPPFIPLQDKSLARCLVSLPVSDHSSCNCAYTTRTERSCRNQALHRYAIQFQGDTVRMTRCIPLRSGHCSPSSNPEQTFEKATVPAEKILHGMHELGQYGHSVQRRTTAIHQASFIRQIYRPLFNF